MSPSPFDILFFAPGEVTDAVMASGLVRRLLDEIDNARFTVVASPATAPLFRAMPRLERGVARDGAGFSAAFSLWRRLRRRRWGLVLDAAGLRLSGLLRARRRVRADPESASTEHKVVQAARLLRLVEDPPAPFLFTDPEIEARAERLLGEGGPILAMAPGGGWIGRTWPTDRFARMAIQLLGPAGPLADGRLLILGGPEDWREAESLRRSIPRARWIDLTGESDPLTLYACLARVRLFVGGATPLTHLAAAAGGPTLALYGPVDEALEGPWGPRARVVRGPRSFAEIKALDGDLDQPICHMMDLSVDTVAAAAGRLLRETEPPARAESRKRRHA